ncbi:MAG: acyl carrier protein [Gammaproteobacteria bacterium]
MDAIADKIKSFIVSEFLDGSTSNVDRHTPLLKTGVIDSIGMFRLFVFLEESFTIRVPEEDLLLENFETMEKIEQYVKARMANGA